ncbi:hypothetical protein AVEN_152937-1 [Araneus ventricosus]|uniref:Reverse transcriptase domain-containing protein n=1 Tax=Araneus ventricosus TaxID=182803 RepID=A0A4Y2AEH8_ARAVE|nr:hypothetical protein AVEN_152937-1 [Araneus ventricosus]
MIAHSSVGKRKALADFGGQSFSKHDSSSRTIRLTVPELIWMPRQKFKNTGTKTTDPYGRPYKAVVKNKHTPTELFKQLGNLSSGDTKSFALKILQELYPPSRSPVPPPNCFPIIQEPQITKKLDKKNTEISPTKKAPGFDAIDYIVLKEVNNSFPEIFHTFYNKCYQLLCFPEPTKNGIIALFHKESKEADKIKSYRPVTLLPTIGKVTEHILLRRLNHTLKNKKTYFITTSLVFERADPLTTPSSTNWLKRYKMLKT